MEMKAYDGMYAMLSVYGQLSIYHGNYKYGEGVQMYDYTLSIIYNMEGMHNTLQILLQTCSWGIV